MANLLQALSYDAKSLRRIDILLHCRYPRTLEKGIVELVFVAVYTLCADWGAL